MNAPFSYLPPDVPQVITFTPSMRRLLADAIEALLPLLDEIDGDADLEDDDPADANGDAEPSLGATNGMNQTIAWRATQGEVADVEDEHDGGEPDQEPRWLPSTVD
jgi:hypothetical protein